MPKADVLPAQACCFTGHRLIPPQDEVMLRQKLYACINELHCAHAISTFYAGGALGFDTMAAQAVLKARKQCPDIRLILVVPYAGQSAGWCEAGQAEYAEIIAAADKVVCLAEHYFNGCMQQRNRFLVDHSGICVCYLTESTGGTAYTVKYAQKRGLAIYNLSKTGV